MSNFKTAQRYANALMQVAIERNEVDAILEDVRFIDNTLHGSRDLVLFLKSPIIKRDKKQKVLKELFSEKVNELTSTFMDIMTRKKREDILSSVFEAFLKKYNEYAGIVDIGVESAETLSKTEVDDLQKALEQKTGKKVHLHLGEDKSLKGGLKIRIEDTVIDGTVKRKLEQLESLFYNTGM